MKMTPDRIAKLIEDLRVSMKLVEATLEELETEVNTGPTAVLRNAVAQLQGLGLVAPVPPLQPLLPLEATTNGTGRYEEPEELPVFVPGFQVDEALPPPPKAAPVMLEKQRHDGDLAPGGGVYLKLSGAGGFAVVDADVYKKIKGGRWNFSVTGGRTMGPGGTPYRQVRGRLPGAKSTEIITLHRWIMGNPPVPVAPRDGDFLNLRRENLVVLGAGKPASPLLKRGTTAYGAKQEADRRGLTVS